MITQPTKRYILTPGGRKQTSTFHGWSMDGDVRWMLLYIKGRKTPASKGEVVRMYIRETGMNRHWAEKKFGKALRGGYIRTVV